MSERIHPFAKVIWDTYGDPHDYDKAVVKWLEARVAEYEKECPSGEGQYLRELFSLPPPAPKVRKVLIAQALIKSDLNGHIYLSTELKEKGWFEYKALEVIKWPAGEQLEIEVSEDATP